MDTTLTSEDIDLLLGALFALRNSIREVVDAPAAAPDRFGLLSTLEQVEAVKAKLIALPGAVDLKNNWE